MTWGELGTDAQAYQQLSARASALLREWVAPSPEQDALREDYLAHLATRPDAVAKAGPPAHLTASCVVVDPMTEQVLLTLHAKGNSWFQFGGHLEPDDTDLHEAATREAREESGIDSLLPLPMPIGLDRHTLSAAFGRCTEHLDVQFVAICPSMVKPQVSDESLDVRWWPIDLLPDPHGASIARMLPLALAAARA